MKEMTPEKERILQFVNEERLVKLGKSMIKIPSPTGEESELARFLEKYMRDNGLKTELIEAEAGRFQPVGVIKGTGGGLSLMFNGHIDAEVPKLGEPWPPVPRVEEGKLYGHGIYNMKGGTAAMIEAAVAVKKSGVKLKGNLIVTPVVGELQGSFGTASNLKRGIRADYALVPEPYDEFFCLTHVGCMQIEVTLRGRSVVTGDMEHGVSVAPKMAKAIDALTNLKLTHKPDPRFPGGPKLSVGSVICGHGDTCSLKGANFLPDCGIMILDIRYLPGMTPQKDVTRVLEKLKAEDPQFNYEKRVTPDAPGLPGMPWENYRITIPPQDLSPDELIVKAHAKNYKALTGKEPRIGAIPPDDPYHYKMYWINDDSLLTKGGIPAFCHGPIGSGTPGQRHVEIDSMMRIAQSYALTAYDICNTPK